MMPNWLVAVFALWGAWGLGVWFRELRDWAKEGSEAGEDGRFTGSYGTADYVFAGFLGLFFVVMIAGSGSGGGELTRQALVNGVGLYGSLAVAVLSFLLMRGMSPGELFGLGRHRAGETEVERASRSPGGDFGRGVVLFAGAYPLVALVHWASMLLAGEAEEAQEIVRFLAMAEGWGDIALVVVLAVIVAPAVEELVFRGYLYGVVRKVAGVWFGAPTTALVFAGVHGHLPSLAALFVLGMALSLIYERTRRLWIVIVLHAVFNAISVAGILLMRDGN